MSKYVDWGTIEIYNKLISDIISCEVNLSSNRLTILELYGFHYNISILERLLQHIYAYVHMLHCCGYSNWHN